MQPKVCVGFATATLAQNRVTDWVAYTHLAYITGNISKVFLMPHTMSYSDLRADDFIPSYEAGDPSLITIAGADDNEDVKGLRWWHHKLEFKWWFLHPVIQEQMWDGSKIDPGTDEIMRQNQIFVLNRGMNNYPQDNIPPMEIVIVELDYSGPYKVVVDETDSILKNIAIQLPEAAQSDHTDEISGGDKPAGKGQSASLSLGLVRALQYMAQDYHAWRMLHVAYTERTR